ncbi:MAG TPA: EthD family reductase [Anaerolineales bacterium]
MSKLIALFKQPADPTAFDQAYFNTHLPLIAKVPGLNKTVVTRFTRTLQGEGFYLMAEMVFDDREALKTGMKSPEMAAAGANLNTFAAGLVTLMFAEEESR